MEPSGSARRGAAERLQDIEAVTDAQLAHLSLDAQLVELVNRVRDVVGADTGTVLLVNDAGDHLVAFVAPGLEEEVFQGVRIRIGTGFAGRIAADKQPRIIDDIDRAEVVNPLLRARGLRSLIGAPLLAGGQVLGVLHVGSVSPGHFSEADIEVLQLVADRVALIVHAHRSDAERKAAAVLQRSFLPQRLAEVSGLETAMRYVPGEGDVGGDWCDLFTLPSGWSCIVVGDVVGRGLRAAIVMGRIRNSVRSYALVADHDPAAILDLADRSLRHFEPSEMATVAVALIEPSLDSFRVSLAGHPAPVLATEDAEAATYLELPVDPPLGVRQAAARRSTNVELPVGAVVAFYTDGLVERRDRPIDARLRQLCATVKARPAEEVCRTVMAGLIGPNPPSDDVAVLTIRRLEPTSPDPPPTKG